MNSLLRTFCLVVLLGTSISSFAQVELGAGASIGFPLSYNKNVGDYNHSSGSPGLRMHFNYVKEDATFIPAVSFNYSKWLLPVVRFGTEKVLSMDFNVTALTLGGMIRKVNGDREFRIGPGIGLAWLKGKGVSINGNPELISNVFEDSSAYITRFTPFVNLSGEYIIPVTSAAPVFLGIGVQLQYAYFFEGDTKYRVDIVDNQFQYYKLEPELSGSVINPLIYVVIYYRFGQKK
jgi:hypothetical protein